MHAPVAAPHAKHCALLTPNAARKLPSQSLARHALAKRHQKQRHTRRSCTVPAAADDADKKQEINLAPAKLKSPAGEMVTYYLKMQPHLFQDAVDQQFRRLQEEKEQAEKAAHEQQEQREKEQKDKSKEEDKGLEVTLYRRVAELRDNEQRATVQDLMYASVLEKFVSLKVDMLPRMDSIITESQSDLKTLTEGIHSKEALDLVREHVLGVMGSAGMAYSNTTLKMSKLQAAQVYAASIMFGYFVRRVDKRFQLDRQLGLVDEPQADAVARLEKLFNTVSDPEDLDQPATPSSTAQDASPPPTSPGSNAGEAAAGPGSSKKKKESPLRKYIEGFDQAALADMTRQVSLEGAALVRVQTSALFGDLVQLQTQMQEVVGQDARSMEELMQRVQQAVEKDEVQSLKITVGTQRRAVLEAIAFGTFLRDVESYVDQEYHLLTPVLPAEKGGMGGPPPMVGL